MLKCGCGRWMHTEGVEECTDQSGFTSWFVRSECRECCWRVGIDVRAVEECAWVDRLMWTDEALQALDRLPPYVRSLVRSQVEEYARVKGQRLITFDLQFQARRGELVTWDPEAEQRLANVPAPVRTMAKIELERTAADLGESRVTVALMDQVKARYFGLGARNVKN